MSIRDELIDTLATADGQEISAMDLQTKRFMYGNQADAILSHFAVVERPDMPIPADPGSAPGVKIWYLAGVTVTAGPGEVLTRQIFQNRGPNGARTLAAVLLEAADHAEAES